MSNPASASPVPQMFNRSTCAKYHHIFVAVFHGYRNYLKLLSSLSCKNPLWHFKNKDDKKNVIDAFQMVWAASHILQVYAFPPTFLIYLLGVCYTLSSHPIHLMNPTLIGLKMMKRRRGEGGRK